MEPRRGESNCTNSQLLSPLRGLGLSMGILVQGLAPLATDGRPSGAGQIRAFRQMGQAAATLPGNENGEVRSSRGDLAAEVDLVARQWPGKTGGAAGQVA